MHFPAFLPPSPALATRFIATRPRLTLPSRLPQIRTTQPHPRASLHHSFALAALPTITVPSAATLTAAATTATPFTLTAILLIAATLGLLSQSTTIGKALSAPVVTTLFTLLLTNISPLPSAHPVYTQVTSVLVPLAVPLLLFAADLRRVLRDTSRLVAVFLLGSIATVLGTLVAWNFVPIAAVLGHADAWKIAAALCARHIGGAVNYVAVAEATAAGPEAVTAALAADNLIVALYFLLLLLLARGVSQPPKLTSTSTSTSTSPSAVTVVPDEDVAPAQASLTMQDGAVALTLSACMCALATFIDALLPFKLGPIPVVTAIALVLATVFPTFFNRYKVPAGAIGVFFMQVFFAATGCAGNISSVLAKAPIMFVFSCVQLAVHLATFLGVGALLKFERSEILIASNANVGGPTTAAGMAAAKQWDRLIIPALLVGVFGYSCATFVSLALGHFVLKPV